MLALALGVPATAAGAAPTERDSDRDKVADGLETRLAEGRALPVIVRLARPASGSRLRRLREAAPGLRAARRFSLIEAFTARLSEAQVRDLVRESDVVRVEPDATVHALNDSAQAAFGVAKARVDAPSLDGSRDGSASAYSAADTVAAVLDTGIDPGHADLNGGKLLGFVDFVNGVSSPYDDEGHGTHVAATLAGDGGARPDRRYRGVAPNAGLVGVKVLDAAGVAPSSRIIAGIQWAVANRVALGIEALNLSLGGHGCSDGQDALSAAVNAASDAGLVVVVAAGNAGPDVCTISSPGAAAKAITVGAMSDLDEGGFFEAYFSSRGDPNGPVKPDISAPGWRITSADAGTSGGYKTVSGTSMAAPFVTGVALLLRDRNPALSPLEVKNLVRSTAIGWGPAGADVDYGAGRLDAYAALRAAGSPLTAPPPAPGHLFRGGSLLGIDASESFSFNVVETRFPIAATAIGDSLLGLDVELFNPDGALVASGVPEGRESYLGFYPSRTGVYSVRVSTTAGAGGPFFLDVSAGTVQPAPEVSVASSSTVSRSSVLAALRTGAKRALKALRKLRRRGLLRRGSFRFLARAPSAGTYEAKLLSRSGLVVGRGKRKFSAAGTKSVRVKLTRRGRGFLRRKRRPRLTLRLAFKPTGEKRVKLSRTLRLR